MGERAHDERRSPDRRSYRAWLEYIAQVAIDELDRLDAEGEDREPDEDREPEHYA